MTNISKVPLPQWIHDDSIAAAAFHPNLLSTVTHHELILRKLKVAYAIAKLIRYAQQTCHRDGTRGNDDGSTAAAVLFDETLFQLDNFVIKLVPTDPPSPSLHGNNGGGGGSIFTTKIVGVDMLSTSLSLNIIEPDFNVLNSFGDYHEHPQQQFNNGRNYDYCGSMEMHIVDPNNDAGVLIGDGGTHCYNNTQNEFGLLSCHFFGVLLHELFAGSHPFPNEDGKDLITNEDKLRWNTQMSSSSSSNEPQLKKTTMSDMFTSLMDEGGVGNECCSAAQNKAFSHVLCIRQHKDDAPTTVSSTQQDKVEETTKSKYIPLKDLGFPSSLSLLVVNMLEAGWGEFRPDDSISSLEVVMDDLKLLLGDPNRFLFDSVETQGGSSTKAQQDKLYGREREAETITNAFYRVSNLGESEVLLVEGFSGCGKSKLIQSVTEQVKLGGDYVIQGKFEEIAQNSSQIGVLTNALNHLCVLISQMNEPEVVNNIVIELMTVFGTRMFALSRVLPNIAMLSQQLNFLFAEDAALNISSVPYILMLFLRVVTSVSRPVMFYLDDLQWADSVSLDVIQCILSDIKGNSRVFVVGSYRNNEITQYHPLRNFIDKIEQGQVESTKIHLEGLKAADVNLLLSDTLGLFPRITRSLSIVIQRKTEGNPFYVLEFINSLVERNLLNYSLRERRWTWDEDKIGSEQISENVSELLAQKMSNIPEERQRALKIASCFGTSIRNDVVSLMVEVAEYSFLARELECAYAAGFLERDIQSQCYKFAHDKVREAAYDQMSDYEQKQLHYDIGQVLLDKSAGLATDKKLFLCADQINRGLTIIRTPEEILKAIQMNHNAASVALKACDFTAAHRYAKTALKLAEDGNQSADYDRISFIMANAAYACGRYDEATNAIESILQREDSLEEKLKFDVYDLKINMLVMKQEGKLAYITCIEVLRKLKDNFASPFASDATDEEFQERISCISHKLRKMTEADLSTMSEMTSTSHLRLMHFYNQLAVVSYFVRPKMIRRITCRLVELTLEYGLSKYTTLSMVRYAMTLPTVEGYRVGKMGMSLVDRFDIMDQIPSIYLGFYAYIAIYAQPVQSCADMLKQAFEIGLSMKDVTTFHNGNQYIHKSLLAGTNLDLLRNISDYQCRLINENSQSTAKMYAVLLNATISTLMKVDARAECIASEKENASKNPEYEGGINFHSAMRSFWFGHYDRCIYHCERGITLSDVKQIKSIMMMFYSGVSSFHSSKKIKSNRNLKNIVKNAIAAMKERKAESSWNYANKLHLLEAESYSINGENDLAVESYTAAIETSKSSKFVHEQGLSCELAALHFKRRKDLKTALNYFRRAKTCYEAWGAQIKVDSIVQQINNIQPSI